MQEAGMPISEFPEWRALADHHERIKDTHLRRLVPDDPYRGPALTVRAGDLYLDYPQNRLARETLDPSWPSRSGWGCGIAPRRCSGVSTSTRPRTARSCTR